MANNSSSPTPILFLIFNRPDTTRIVFNRIREIRPERLYVAADAPREGRAKEIALCEEARRIIDDVDWPCEVKTLFRDRNLGCKQAISSALTWFSSRKNGVLSSRMIVCPICRSSLFAKNCWNATRTTSVSDISGGIVSCPEQSEKG